MGWLTLQLAVTFDVKPKPVTKHFNYAVRIEETPNYETPCAYGSNGKGCSDRVTIRQVNKIQFKLGDTYTVKMTGFKVPGASWVKNFVTEEDQDNSAELFLEFTAPVKKCAKEKGCISKFNQCLDGK
eukprot:NODE_3112_length_596_cov_61.550274_g2605_i0.p3 GENE.NODE_3112_length_596_cov_61.550274_g2605_i0~~NODE_3112_length_596_cov_61.550274_g2605_i0.p3  ORF type:complete len:127 (-),score=30.89 NODE_3112_length_596_cov_61.550274_g2605_i0:188-568(-)